MANFIWDLDGTLINSYPHTLEALAQTYQDFGLSFDRDMVASYIIDYSIRDLIANLVASGQVERDPFVARLKQATAARDGQIGPMEGADATLAGLKQAGNRHFVYTHKDKAAFQVLERLGWSDYFDEVITIEAGFKRKPDPQGVHYLLAKYQLDPAQTYYVGDRDLDIECALAAGVGSINFIGAETGQQRVMTQLKDILDWFAPSDGPVTPEFQAKLAASLSARLTPLDHLSLNAVFRADLPQYQRRYFVKVYAEADKFKRDKLGLLAIWPDWYVADLVLEGRHVLIQDWQELDPVVTPSLEDLGKLGELLAQTHLKLAPLADHLRRQPPLSQQVTSWHQDLLGSSEAARLAPLYDFFQARFEQIDAEYASLPQAVLHGDYSWRNLKRRGDEWAVIDFERLVVDIPWRELGKLWLREVKSTEERQAFLAGYRKILPLQEPSPLLDACLSFQLAQGIYRYVLKVDDREFRQTADGVIEDVKAWCKNQGMDMSN